MKRFVSSKKVIQDFVAYISGSGIDTRNDNLLRLTLGEVLVYLEFLETIYERYAEAAKQYLEASKKLHDLTKGKSGTLTKEGSALFEKMGLLSPRLRLEIESFHLFVHILLNKITNFPERFFQHSYRRALGCSSHHKFWKNIVEIEHFRPIPEKLKKDSTWLQTKVTDYRDHSITHTFGREHVKRMLIKGFTYKIDDEWVKTTSITLYPDEQTNDQVESENLEEINVRLQSYIQGFFDFLKEHSDKSILTK